jgi:NTP pyrophosphatase (non-canonical NTP hydrolase)
MTLDEYQALCAKNGKFDTKSIDRLTFAILAMAGEAGETANELKKMHRDDMGELTSERRAKILLELGDVMWYIVDAASALDASLEDIVEATFQKIAARYGS